MNKKAKITYLILFSFILYPTFYNSSINVVAEEYLPLIDTRPGWDVLPIYEIAHPPGPICIGEHNDTFYGDNLNHILMRMDEFGIQTEYIATGTLTFDDIAYQTNHNRLIGVTDHGFYTITSSGITWLNNYSYGSFLTTITVDPTDDSFYCGSLFDNTDILYFDANGIYISTVASNIHGCSEILLNNNQSILYYTETYLGSFSSLNLSSSETQVVKTGIGLPGTQEVIGIGVDDHDDLYYMTADGNNRGFYKYVNDSFIFIMNSKAGMSKITWSPKLKSFIAGGSAGACLISYNQNKTEAELLTPMVNANTIIETNNGTILYAIEDEIYQINQSGPLLFSTAPSNFSIIKLIVNVENKIFAALGNDSVTIVEINYDGSIQNWFDNEIQEFTKSIHYDQKYDDIILLTEDSIKNETIVYRIPIEDPLAYHKITTFYNSTKTAGVTDDQGNIYIYEGYNNSLFRIPDGTSDKELLTTSFVNFTDIYGPDIIVIPPLGYSTVENGILIGRNDDLHIWLLNENQRTIFAINNRGIDNSAIFQNNKQEIICTQSTLILKMIYQKPQNPTTLSIGSYYILPMLFFISVVVIIERRKLNR
ncbi:MAG: hypothetical protein ACFE8G_12755 [Candidatus Hermodarchaeota archaeon]